MSKNNCNPCKDSVFKTISSNPDFSDILEFLENNGGDNVNVLGDEEFIFVEESMVGDVKTFTVRYEPYVPLSVSMGNNINTLQLLGTTINNITLNWSYNKPIETQTLVRNGTIPTGVPAITTPVVTTGTSYSIALTGQNITTNTSYTISGDDIIDDNRGPKSDSTGVSFGNYIYRTVIQAPNRESITTATINALDLPSIVHSLTTNRITSFTAQSIEGQYEVILMPNRFGLTSGTQFKYKSYEGGWSKLFNIKLTNSAGYEEPDGYDVWVSAQQNLNGLVFSIS